MRVVIMDYIFHLQIYQKNKIQNKNTKHLCGKALIVI